MRPWQVILPVPGFCQYLFDVHAIVRSAQFPQSNSQSVRCLKWTKIHFMVKETMRAADDIEPRPKHFSSSAKP